MVVVATGEYAYRRKTDDVVVCPSGYHFATMAFVIAWERHRESYRTMDYGAEFSLEHGAEISSIGRAHRASH